jgi:hypothetical protein
MRLFSFSLLLTGFISLAQIPTAVANDPDLVDIEMTKVMYIITPNDVAISAYQGGHPSELKLKLCQECQVKPYALIENAELLLNEQPLALKDLTITLIKKKFDVIQLGIDRSNKTVTYLYLGGISESSAEELAQEQSDEN